MNRKKKMRGSTQSFGNNKGRGWRQPQWVREKWNGLSASKKEHQKYCCTMNRQVWSKVDLLLLERWIPLTKTKEVKPLVWVEALHSYGVCWICIKGSFSSLFVHFTYSSIYLTYQSQTPPHPSLPVPFSHPPPPTSQFPSIHLHSGKSRPPVSINITWHIVLQ